MRKHHFDASVCRESDQHDWRWFVQYSVGSPAFKQTESCLFDATPEGLEQCLKMTDMREFCLRDCGYTRQIVDAYFYACDLNTKAAA